jgi:hypothetical protein
MMGAKTREGREGERENKRRGRRKRGRKERRNSWCGTKKNRYIKLL